MFFFQGILPTPSSLYRQSQRHIFILSKPNDTIAAATRLHDHAVFSNEIKQQQTGHVLLMSRATWTNDFLNQQAMITGMEYRAHFFISNYVRPGNPSSDEKSLIFASFVSGH